ncbi:MAG: phenylalanine--tRNA ligase subunit beta, partial [Chloroflexota bacterium]|nr:phenylalanine--tRNA ligase subunit beta [Chloroflexota bacterium]
KVGDSPDWMQRRLLACGMRPINNIVDITNYVMLEIGQPLHAFDYRQVRGQRIIVRRAAQGEKMVTLDGLERALTGDMLVIADAERAVAVAGVMGGADTEVTPGTTSILLEAASFKPTSIHYTGRSLSLSSEASMRFERGIRPELALLGLKRATQLLTQLAGGQAAKGVIDVYPGKKETGPITLPVDRVKQLLGVEFSAEQIVKTLTSLGFDCRMTGSAVQATAPYWRSDIRLPVDLVEEVARVAGYDKIPSTMLSQSIPRQNPAPVLSLKQKVRRHLTGSGFQEVVTYSLVSIDSIAKLLPEPHPLEPPPLRLVNPMTADLECLRPNLRCNLLPALAANRRHEDGSIRLFELGKIYVPRAKDLPDEPEVLCGILSGPRLDKSWHGGDEPVDFFDAKGVVEALLNGLGVTASFEKSSDESLHPGKQAALVVEGKRLGVVGELHPKVSEAFEITDPVYLFEVNLAELLPFATGYRLFQPIPRFPSITRDIALVVDTAVSHQQVCDIIRGFSLVSQVTLFDVYSGGQVPPGKKSFAYRLTFQSPTHTLTDEEANAVQQQILDKLAKELGAVLRA